MFDLLITLALPSLSCVVSLSELGAAGNATLRTLCGCTAAYVDLHVAAFESGKKLGSMDKFVKDNKTALNAEGMSQMYGAWMAQFGASTSAGGKHVAFLRAQ